MRRSRLRVWLVLARVSNLPTVWTNVMAALFAARAGLDTFLLSAAAMSLFYMGGMFLNDAFDAEADAAARADRPIPAGEISRSEVVAIGVGLLMAGELLLLRLPHAGPALAWGAGLAAAIVFYDLRHKGRWYGPVVMGLCRALVYCTAAVAATGTLPASAAIAAGVMWVYVIALTLAAKTANAGYAVPWLIAGICLVDAAMIAWAGDMPHAAVAASAFVLTIWLQRFVSGN